MNTNSSFSLESGVTQGIIRAEYSAIVLKVGVTWSSRACNCCPHDMCRAVIQTNQGETLEIETSLVSENEIVFKDEEGDWLPQV